MASLSCNNVEQNIIQRSAQHELEHLLCHKEKKCSKNEETCLKDIATSLANPGQAKHQDITGYYNNIDLQPTE